MTGRMPARSESIAGPGAAPPRQRALVVTAGAERSRCPAPRRADAPSSGQVRQAGEADIVISCDHNLCGNTDACAREFAEEPEGVRSAPQRRTRDSAHGGRQFVTTSGKDHEPGIWRLTVECTARTTQPNPSEAPTCVARPICSGGPHLPLYHSFHELVAASKRAKGL